MADKTNKPTKELIDRLVYLFTRLVEVGDAALLVGRHDAAVRAFMQASSLATIIHAFEIGVFRKPPAPEHSLAADIFGSDDEGGLDV